MTYISIASWLKTILETVRDAVWSKLVAVYDYDIPSAEVSEWYPYACISNGDMDEGILDSADNTAVFTFVIRVKDIAKEKTTTEARMRALCDTIMAELRKRTNLYLSGSSENTLPFNVHWSWDTGATSPHRIFEITIKVQKSFSTL